MVAFIDGKDLIYGRLASVVAERIMDGEEIIILNSESIIITGEKEMVCDKFKHRTELGDATKRKGPFYPRRADLIFKRSVRGMIPWKSSSGRDAYRRLHVYVGTPKQFAEVKTEAPELAKKKITGKYTTLGAVSKFLGSNVR
ncbi:MAG: 50S ribosomal protein L13 [Candidatus Methanomethylophilaceae archaeon]|jgi:large subunit ribosomal protein L13|nr:50S ribosomal protein L13 [Candidatus Methanomethylophilaceae archaeon]MDD3351305.1 50S ribosomal protein L13 [Candidatus Methanomethylophilaceae archaeon]MDD3986677.1 50S ribosomal protein L13 [Candidatus Methanomethylophilaceae archaeon]MDD4709387.1 50S ribosomal protein L13 [Candidatus Methanomethylophilaceae archaeon]